MYAVTRFVETFSIPVQIIHPIFGGEEFTTEMQTIYTA